MGYPVTNTLSTPLSRDTYICRVGLGLNMRCFVCKKETRTEYRPGFIVKVCDICKWESTPVKIPESLGIYLQRHKVIR